MFFNWLVRKDAVGAGFADPKGLIKVARKRFLGVVALPQDH